MNKAEYIAIRDQLSFEKNPWINFALILCDIALVALAVSWVNDGPILFLLSQIVLSIVYFHSFALLHEAGHGNISKHRMVNHVVGFYASALSFLPYFPWKYIHKEHHMWAGNIDKDPTMEKLRDVREKKHVPWLMNFAWRSWIPLAAFAQQAVFWRYPITLIKNNNMSAGVFYQCLVSVLWLVVVYFSLYWFFPNTVNLANIWLSYVFYMMLTELINFPHHINMPTFHTSEKRSRLKLWEQHVTTRSCDYGVFSGLLALNFNYHIEHHYFPHLPWYKLGQLSKILRPALNTQYTGLKGISWNIENRRKRAETIILPEVQHEIL